MKSSQRQRLLLVIAVIAGAAVTISLIIYALRSNIDLFYTPGEVIYGKGAQRTLPQAGQRLQVGGMVLPGSIERDPDSLKVRFVLYDNEADLTVYYEGILPDLFSEGQSAVAQGVLQADHTFLAHKILAKHDENYTPPEVQDAMQRNHNRSAEAYEK